MLFKAFWKSAQMMRSLTMVTGVVNMLFNNMSTGLREEGATVSNKVFNTPNASGESKCIYKETVCNFSHHMFKTSEQYA